MSVVTDIVWYIVTNVSGQTATNTKEFEMPDEVSGPLACVAVYQYGGMRYRVGKYEEASVQVRVRAATASAAWSKADAIQKALCGMPAATVINAHTYMDVKAEADKNWMGRNKAKHPEFSINFIVVRLSE